MTISRKGAANRCSRTMVAVTYAAFAAIGSSVTSSTGASAQDLPFWEQAGAGKATSKRTKARIAKLGGYAEETSSRKTLQKKVQIAALGGFSFFDAAGSGNSLSGGGVKWIANAGCLNPGLKSAIYDIAANLGPVTVNSTCRSRNRNASAGGARRSLHLSGNAVDFRVRASNGKVYAYLKSLRASGSVGGVKHYGGGLFHIDNGAARSW